MIEQKKINEQKVEELARLKNQVSQGHMLAKLLHPINQF